MVPVLHRISKHIPHLGSPEYFAPSGWTAVRRRETSLKGELPRSPWRATFTPDRQSIGPSAGLR
jgi:hypothetical protein